MTMVSVLATMVAQPYAQVRAVAVDAAAGQRVLDTLRTAEDQGNPALVLRTAEAALEHYANDPYVRASLYETMARAADAAGRRAADVARYSAVARVLDPNIDARMNSAAAPTTRGQQGSARNSKLEKLTAAVGIFAATLGAIQEGRNQLKQQRQMRDGGGMNGGMPGGMNGGMGGNMGGGMPGGQMPSYPASPVGSPGYNAPTGGQMAMPGYGASSYGPQSGQMAQQQGGYMPANYTMPADPYRAPAGYAAGPVVRGAAVPLRAVIDQATATDDTLFANPCGALLAVDGRTLTVTPGCGIAPRAIPASDVLSIGLNRTVGAELGAFHIETAQGLYLRLAPESGRAEDGRAIVDRLQQQLAGGTGGRQ